MPSSRACSRPSCFSLAGFRAVSGSASSWATSSARASAWRSRASTAQPPTVSFPYFWEPLHASGRVHEFLLPREVGVALGADIHVDDRDRGARHEAVAAGALHGGPLIGRMNPGFHWRCPRVECADGTKPEI